MTMRRAHTAAAAGSWPADQAVDTLSLTLQDRHRRRVRLRGDGGTDILLDLAEAMTLRDGDGLLLDEGDDWVAVKAAPEPVLEITAADPLALARLAWHLGNRHTPTEIQAGRLVILYDHVLADMLMGLGATVRRTELPFNPEAGAYHGQAHAHVDEGQGHTHSHSHSHSHTEGDAHAQSHSQSHSHSHSHGHGHAHVD